MIGYWSPDCPVRTDNEAVLATVYAKQGAALIALASWAAETVQCRLRIDWEALGIDPRRADLSAPAITDFQPRRTFRIGDPVPVQPGRGWLLMLKQR